ncbi:hypothetical protein [Nocardia lijiangensis]|uniref:Rv1733c family protein n=1 Tax=Nocardia lijiangensis TaxID=299618 RepID=UPI00082B7348|nr:hypothetical protein [Nocardia lijiangensis]
MGYSTRDKRTTVTRFESLAWDRCRIGVAGLWARRPWNPNPLLRAGDRLDTTIRVLAVLAGLFAVPLAGALATITYTDSAGQIAAQRAILARVDAMVITDPVQTGPTRCEATVQWVSRGAAANARIAVPRSVARGDHLTVWLGPDGTPTTEPRSSEAAAVTGIGVGALVLIGSWLGAWALVTTTGRLLARRRSRDWAIRWRQMNRRVGEDGQ